MKSTSKTVTTTAAEIVAVEPTNRNVWLHVVGTGTIYLGGTDVSSTNGLMTQKNTTPLAVRLPAGEPLWAVTATSSEEVRILVEGD